MTVVYFRNLFFPYSKKLNLLGKSLRNGSKGMRKLMEPGIARFLDALFFLRMREFWGKDN